MATIIGKKEVRQKFNRLKEYLIDTGLMQTGIISKIARNLGITPNAVWQWVHNKQDPPLAQLLRLCAYLKCKPEELIVENNPFAKPI